MDFLESELAKLRSRHASIFSVVHKTNRVYQLVLFLSTIFCVFDTIFCFYAVFNRIIAWMQFRSGKSQLEAVLNLIWGSLLMINLAHLAWHCEQAVKEVNIIVFHSTKNPFILFVFPGNENKR